MPGKQFYDTNLAMGLGLIDETKALLRVWQPWMDAHALYEAVLAAGILSEVTAYRLRNIVVRCFGNRYLLGDAAPARYLQRLLPVLSYSELGQLFYLYTCRANPILADFVREVYWNSYSSGARVVTKDRAEEFIRRAIDDKKTPSRWADGQIERVGRYLTGCCADFGLLGHPAIGGRLILPFRIEQKTLLFLAHELHFGGTGDNALLSHPDWQLFGLAREDVLEELKRLALQGFFIVQAAGDVIRISWKHQDMEALCDVLTQS
jgi:hypothetical protein